MWLFQCYMLSKQFLCPINILPSIFPYPAVQSSQMDLPSCFLCVQACK